ncbi:hypothetical protein J6N69_01370 [bacterium]|nr:hypothetical protein [bacterium]MBP3847461.1 hypothetical protein [bacterium]
MVRTIKTIIKNLARNAVLIAEKEFGSGNGQAKKQMAIEYIIKNLPFPEPIKRIISFLLSKMIDELVESAVEWLHNQTVNQGE